MNSFCIRLFPFGAAMSIDPSLHPKKVNFTHWYCFYLAKNLQLFSQFCLFCCTIQAQRSFYYYFLAPEPSAYSLDRFDYIALWSNEQAEGGEGAKEAVKLCQQYFPNIQVLLHFSVWPMYSPFYASDTHLSVERKWRGFSAAQTTHILSAITNTSSMCLSDLVSLCYSSLTFPDLMAKPCQL